MAPTGGNAAYEPHTDHDQDPDPIAELALTLQALFRSKGRTLTDKATAGDYDISLTAVQLMLQGCLARGVLTADAHLEVNGMLEGMREAVGHISPD